MSVFHYEYSHSCWVMWHTLSSLSSVGLNLNSSCSLDKYFFLTHMSSHSQMQSATLAGLPVCTFLFSVCRISFLTSHLFYPKCCHICHMSVKNVFCLLNASVLVLLQAPLHSLCHPILGLPGFGWVWLRSSQFIFFLECVLEVTEVSRPFSGIDLSVS